MIQQKRKGPTRRPTRRRTSSTPQKSTSSKTTTGHKQESLKADRLRVIPFGGVEEVGENMTVFEYGDDILVLDMGLAFPDETMPGVDYIIPDTKYLQKKKKNIKGVIITHGHLDHIGAVPYILPKIGDPPIYTMPLTAAFVEKRLEEFNLKGRSQIHLVDKDKVLKLGAFSIRFFRLNHNIPDSMGVSIKTDAAHVVYATDWKFDHTPVDGKPSEFAKIATLGSEGVDLLMSDSTNATVPGYSMSERELSEKIDRIVKDTEGRMIFATFSTLISRIQQAIDAAVKTDRKVVVTGRSMVNSVEIGHNLGYLNIPKHTVITAKAASKLPDSKVLILTTGSQGEEFAALARIARQEHKTIKIRPGDTVVLSASPIPGNERAVGAVMNDLTRQGAHVLYQKILDVHTSGHAKQEDLKLMISLIRPKYFMPIHGEHHMLVAHAELAETVGIKKENIFTVNNGEIIELNQEGAKKTAEQVSDGIVFVDGLGVGDVGEVVLRDRQVMSTDGMFVVIMTIERRTGKLVNQPDILSRGFVYMKSSEDLIREVKHEVRKVVETKNGKPHEANWAYIRNQVRDQVGEFLFRKTERRPMVLPVIIQV